MLFGQVSTTTAVEKGRSSQRSLFTVHAEDYKPLNTKRLHELHNFLFNQEPATNILRLQPVFHRLFHRLFLVSCGEPTCRIFTNFQESNSLHELPSLR
jgi:hypothetical protein